MKIDWTALALVAGVSITMTVLFVVLLSLGIRLVSSAEVGARRPVRLRRPGGGVCAARPGGHPCPLRPLSDRAAVSLTRPPLHA